jgi:hypothetical protein
MTPYPHPAANLAVFQARLTQDINNPDNFYTLVCGAPTLTANDLNLEACGGMAANYNSQVDMEATAGDLSGEVDGYLYNRLDLSQLPTVLDGVVDTTLPFIKGSGTILQDILPAINARWGTTFDVTDIVALQLPVCTDPCGCSCGGGNDGGYPGAIGMALEATANSLLYLGQTTIYIVASQSLADALQCPFIPTLGLPPVHP